ncbi:MAG TPA: T9SS type A sorting domain-containing protein, partial [Chitinophagales bacterium]|nr:T9SS type A sorting domain-containing protein [Chitinophagales bacterium]
ELVNLYPNPASDIVMLNGTALKGKFAVEVYNNIGNKVLVENSTTTIYTGKLTAGAYIMVINLADGKSIRKQFVITR